MNQIQQEIYDFVAALLAGQEVNGEIIATAVWAAYPNFVNVKEDMLTQEQLDYIIKELTKHFNAGDKQ